MDLLFLKVLVQIFNAWFLSKPTVGPYVVEFKSSGIFNNEVTGPTEPSNISCGALKIPQSQGLENAGNTFASPSFSRRKIPLPRIPLLCFFWCMPNEIFSD